MKKTRTKRTMICFLLVLCMGLAPMTAMGSTGSGSKATTFKVKSKIDGTTLKCSTNGSVSKILRTEAYGPWDNAPTMFLPNVEYWSDGVAECKRIYSNNDGGWTSCYHFVGSDSEAESLVNDYSAVMEAFGFECAKNDKNTVTGYSLFRTLDYTYNGNGDITRGVCDSSYWDGPYDAEIEVFKDNYKDYVCIYLTLPDEIGVKDTGARRKGGSVEPGGQTSVQDVKSSQSYYILWGEYDTFTIYGFGNSEDYIDIKLKPGTYKKGDTFTYDDFMNLNDVNYTILSHEIVEDDIYNYIKPTDNKNMIKDFQVKVLKATSKVKALYYYIVVCDTHSRNYVLEGIVAYDKNRKSTVQMDYKSNGKTKTIKNGASVKVKAGTTYKVKKGSTITLKSPNSSAGYSYYAYSFYANKTGIVETGHSDIGASFATITAKKKGTIYYKVSFTGSRKVTKVNSIKVPGTSSTYKQSTYQVYESDVKEQIIKIVVTN